MSAVMDMGLNAEQLADAIAHDAPRLLPHDLMKAYLKAALRQAELCDMTSNYQDEILALQQLIDDADDRPRTLWSDTTRELAMDRHMEEQRYLRRVQP